MSVATRRAIVASPVGLHARPAAVFVRAVVDSGLAVTIAKVPVATGVATDARSILGVLALDVRHGDEVELSTDGAGADSALARLAALLESAD